jgi:hypothetical protein
MPTFENPTADAMEASEALRGLAHATRMFDNPADTYAVLGDLLGGVRSLRQVLDQLATAHVSHRVRAHDDGGSQAAGSISALAAANELQRAVALLDGVHDRLDAAKSQSGRIAWHEAPAEAPPANRWINVVFLEGQDADQVLDLINHSGTDAAIEHLAGYDVGEETTQAALVNGYVYDRVPAGALDRIATGKNYTLTYNHDLGHVSLFRTHPAAPPQKISGTQPQRAAPRTAFRRPARTQTADDDWSLSRPSSVSRGRSL